MHPEYHELCEIRRHIAGIALAVARQTGPISYGALLSVNLDPAIERSLMYESLVHAAAKIDRAAETSTDLSPVLKEVASDINRAEELLGIQDEAVVLIRRAVVLATRGARRWYQFWK